MSVTLLQSNSSLFYHLCLENEGVLARVKVADLTRKYESGTINVKARKVENFDAERIQWTILAFIVEF